MSEFHSYLANSLHAYLKYRKDVGYTYHRINSFLSTFDRYVERTGTRLDQMSPTSFLEFRRTIQGEPGTANKTLIIVRGFFDYLVRMDRISSNPLTDIPPLAENSYIPFVFSPRQVESFLCAVEKRIQRDCLESFLEGLAIHAVLYTMAVCGLRISEPLRLKTEHYRPDELTLHIEKTKFNKDRLIPIPGNAAAVIDNFLSVRQGIIGHQPYHPATETGPVSCDHIRRVFHQAVLDIEIKHPRQTIGGITFGHPRPHSRRHSFAVNTLGKACSKGRYPENVLPVLAAYMGLTDYRYTMKYLKVLDSEHLNAWVDFCVFKKRGDER